MKVLALNSSPRSGGQSKTELMLNHLVAGMRDAGAEVEVVNLREKKIDHCLGCFTCWTKTPGKCVQNDDMTRGLFPKWLEADLAVYASPLYYHTLNSAMGAFRERTLPAVLPFFEQDENGAVSHPLRAKVPPSVYLSVCGFPQDSEFDALSDFLHRTAHPDAPIVAEIYRSSAESMSRPFFKDKSDDILAATRQAGREIVENMAVSPATMARIRQPMVDPHTFAEMGNLFWKSCIAEGVTPKTFRERKMVPRPESLESFMLLLQMGGLNGEAAGDRKAVVQFLFSGQVKDACHFVIDQGRIEAIKGIREDADLVIETPFGLWMDIMTRKVDGQQMFLAQKFRVKGDLSFMIQLFKRENDAKKSS